MNFALWIGLTKDFPTQLGKFSSGFHPESLIALLHGVLAASFDLTFFILLIGLSVQSQSPSMLWRACSLLSALLFFAYLICLGVSWGWFCSFNYFPGFKELRLASLVLNARFNDMYLFDTKTSIQAVLAFALAGLMTWVLYRSVRDSSPTLKQKQLTLFLLFVLAAQILLSQLAEIALGQRSGLSP